MNDRALYWASKKEDTVVTTLKERDLRVAMDVIFEIRRNSVYSVETDGFSVSRDLLDRILQVYKKEAEEG